MLTAELHKLFKYVPLTHCHMVVVSPYNESGNRMLMSPKDLLRWRLNPARSISTPGFLLSMFRGSLKKSVSAFKN